MKPVFTLLFLFTCVSSCSKKGIHSNASINNETMPATEMKYHYLALGDSYTIGESVAMQENFPNQSAALLAKDSIYLYPPRIIARTGWTTNELKNGISASGAAEPLRNPYDFVSLLIGVNNQYRGYPPDIYKTEFEDLLKKAILYAGNRPERVIVLSIPDWGVTPFAEGRDRARIAAEIDVYNRLNKEIAIRYNVRYLDITPWTREAAADPSLLAPDGLHPSGKEYRRWAEQVALFFKSVI